MVMDQRDEPEARKNARAIHGNLSDQMDMFAQLQAEFDDGEEGDEVEEGEESDAQEELDA